MPDSVHAAASLPQQEEQSYSSSSTDQCRDSKEHVREQETAENGEEIGHDDYFSAEVDGELVIGREDAADEGSCQLESLSAPAEADSEGAIAGGSALGHDTEQKCMPLICHYYWHVREA